MQTFWYSYTIPNILNFKNFQQLNIRLTLCVGGLCPSIEHNENSKWEWWRCSMETFLRKNNEAQLEFGRTKTALLERGVGIFWNNN